MNKYSTDEVAHRYSRVWRATRKALGKNQTEFAKLIGMSQSKLSAIESGKTFAKWPEETEFTRVTKISLAERERGYVYHFQGGDTVVPFSKRLEFVESKEDLNFKFPDRYSGPRGSTTMSFRNIVEFARKCWGYRKTSHFFQLQGFDEDYLVFLNRQISMQLWFDLFMALTKDGFIYGSVDKTKLALRPFAWNDEESLGRERQFYKTTDNLGQILSRRLEQASQSVECNHIYSLHAIDEKKVRISVEARSEIYPSYKNENIRHLITLYRCAYVEDFVQKVRGLNIDTNYEYQGNRKWTIEATVSA